MKAYLKYATILSLLIVLVIFNINSAHVQAFTFQSTDTMMTGKGSLTHGNTFGTTPGRFLITGTPNCNRI